MKLILAKWPDTSGVSMHLMEDNYTWTDAWYSLDEIGCPEFVRWIELEPYVLCNYIGDTGIDIGAYHYHNGKQPQYGLVFWDRLFRFSVRDGVKVFHMEDYYKNPNCKMVHR